MQAWVWGRGGYSSAWDDMAITASFARTFADHGRISLTASSEVVEGFSTPLWFLILAFCRKAFALDAHALYRTAQALSSSLLIATLLLLGATVARLVEDARSAVWALAGLCLLVLWPPFVRESVNGMENPLIAFLLAGAVWWSGAQPVALAAAGILIVWLRVEGGIFVLPLAYAGRSRRAFLTVGAAAVGAFLAQEAWRFWVFGGLVPNTVLAKLHEPYSVAGTARAMLAARVRYLPSAAPLAFLPLALVYLRRWTPEQLREETRPGGALDPAIVAAIGAAGGLTLLVGREWGYPGRMIFPLSVVGVSGLVMAAARSGSRIVRAASLLACGLLVAPGASRLDRSAPNGDVITVENYRVSNALPLTRLAVAAGRQGLVVATPDVGGTSLFGPTHTIVDTGLLCNRRLATFGYDALADEVFGERMADVVDTHTVFTRVSGIQQGRPLEALMANYLPASVGGKLFYLHRRLLASVPASRVTQVPMREALGPRRAEILGRQSTYSRLDMDLAGRFPSIYIVRLDGAPS